MSRGRCRFLWLFAGAILPLAPASGATIYSLLDYPGASSTLLSGVNNEGVAVGFYLTGQYHGFIHQNGTFIPLQFPGSVSTMPNGINDAGTIVGTYTTDAAGLTHHSFVYSAGLFTSFDAPGNGYASGINDSGVIVGGVGTPGGHAFVLEPSGSFQMLDFPGGGTTSAFGINSAGEITGMYGNASSVHGFIYSPVSGWTSFDNPTHDTLVVYGINDLRQVVGNFWTSNDLHPFLRLPDGSFIDIASQLPGYPTNPHGCGGCAPYSYLLDLNNEGTVVGYYQGLNGPRHGLIAQLDLSVVVTPEPAAGLLTLGGVLCLLGAKRLRRDRGCRNRASA